MQISINAITSGINMEVRTDPATGHHALHATISFKKGETILPFAARTTQNFPTYLTVQLTDEVHITLSPTWLQYVNHSCKPNTFFDTDNMFFVALEDIVQGEEFTFFYPSTEWKMAQPFLCRCGQPTCLGEIKGAAYLNEVVRKQHRFTGYVVSKIQQ